MRHMRGLLIFPLTGAGGIAAYWAYMPSSQIYSPTISHGPQTERPVALTFDDGPSDPGRCAPPMCCLHKYAAEAVLRTFDGLSWAILRLSNIYGLRQRADAEGGVVAIFCQRLLAGDPIVVHGDGSRVRDFIHVSDVVGAVLAGLATILFRVVYYFIPFLVSLGLYVRLLRQRPTVT